MNVRLKSDIVSAGDRARDAGRDRVVVERFERGHQLVELVRPGWSPCSNACRKPRQPRRTLWRLVPSASARFDDARDLLSCCAMPVLSCATADREGRHWMNRGSAALSTGIDRGIGGQAPSCMTDAGRPAWIWFVMPVVTQRVSAVARGDSVRGRCPAAANRTHRRIARHDERCASTGRVLNSSSPIAESRSAMAGAGFVTTSLSAIRPAHPRSHRPHRDHAPCHAFCWSECENRFAGRFTPALNCACVIA
jgi:hypothetical protein